ncbi:MAG: uroporphyrinogen decarboxylase family protein [Lachnospiraceae bacterium]|nr:uroporphyrinogen decarboxylase family protein [Lachnospiraceae bacterium]
MTEKENLLRAFHLDHPEWIPNANTAALTIQAWNTVRDRPAGDAYDWYGVHWKDFVVVPGEQLMNDITEWEEKVHFPDLEAIDWEKGAEIDCQGIDRKKQALWIRLPVGLFERMHALMNFEEALMSFLLEPEETERFLDALTDFRIRCLDKLITYYQPDIISMHDDYGTQKDLFMSPEIWRKFFKKNITRISDYVKSRGVIFSLHSCGKVDRLIGDFVDCGIDSWDSVQPCCDIPAIYEEYGTKLSFSPFVGIQSVSGDFGTPETARQEMRWTIDTMAKHGGLIPLTNAPLCSKKMMDAMEQELVEYGRDYYINNPIR